MSHARVDGITEQAIDAHDCADQLTERRATYRSRLSHTTGARELEGYVFERPSRAGRRAVGATGRSIPSVLAAIGALEGGHPPGDDRPALHPGPRGTEGPGRVVVSTGQFFGT